MCVCARACVCEYMIVVYCAHVYAVILTYDVPYDHSTDDAHALSLVVLSVLLSSVLITPDVVITTGRMDNIHLSSDRHGMRHCSETRLY